MAGARPLGLGGNFMRESARSRSSKGSLVLMFAALTLLTLYLANITPMLRVALFFVCSIFIFGIMMEHMPGAAFITFGVVTVVGFLIVPDKAGVLPYLFFFGHYGIFKYYVEGVTRGATTTVSKLVYFTLCAALIYFFGGGFLMATFPIELPLWLLIVAGEVIFLLYDWLLTKLAGWYLERARPALMGRRGFE